MEFELKLEIPSDRLAALSAELRVGETSRQRLQAQYFDTQDGALARHALVLRLRKEGQAWVQTAKGATKDSLERLEHNVAIARTKAGGVPALDLSRHAGTLVGDRIAQALTRTYGNTIPPLIPLYQTDVQRLKQNIEFAGSVLEVALDQGRIVAGPHAVALCELEVELIAGKPEHAVQFARDCCARHGLWLSMISKAMKGQRLGSASPVVPAVFASAPAFKRRANAEQISIAVLQSCLSQVLGNASEVASGSQQLDHIHQLRVGIRRLRTALSELRPLVPGLDLAWEAPLVATFRALGQQRDQSHLALSLQPLLETAGGPAVHSQSLGAGIPDPGLVVRSPAFQHSLLSLISFVQGLATGKSGASSKDTKKVLSLSLQKLHSQVLKGGQKFLKLDESQQHQVRKRLKHLRYLSEFVAPLYSTGRTDAFLSGLKPVQDALGMHNDELIALLALRKLAEQDPLAWFGVGWLSARRKPNAGICQQELLAFAKLRPFWT